MRGASPLDFTGGPITTGAVQRVLALYGLGAGEVELRQGTASQSVVADTAHGRVVIRRRRPEFCEPEVIRHDHALRAYLTTRGFPCPALLPAADGETWVELDGAVYEISSFVAGEPFDAASDAHLAGLGRTLGWLHELTCDWSPPAPKPWVREDHPSLLMAPLQDLIARAEAPARATLLRARERLVEIAAEMPDGAYAALPQCTIHGDVHPGNVLFDGGRVAALVDWDWASRQPRIRDVCDGLIYFAAQRESAIDGSDVRSLCQPWRLDLGRAAALLNSYRERQTLCEAEACAAPWQMASRWLQCRIRGARKVPEAERVRFVADGLLEPIDDLWRQREGLMGALSGR